MNLSQVIAITFIVIITLVGVVALLFALAGLVPDATSDMD